jgi:hypothetical protein
MTPGKRAFLILGPESSGTRLLTRLLMAGGCTGSHEHSQPFDQWQDKNGFGGADLIVWRRSFPWTEHHLWPNIELDLWRPLRQYGYNDTTALVIVRNWLSLWKSQVDPRNHHAPNEEAALENISLAYSEIFTQLGRLQLPSIVVTYESLTGHGEKGVRPLLKKLGLNCDAPLPEIKPEREGYY